MSLPPRLQGWVDQLTQHHHYRVDLTLTQNRRSMISIQQQGPRHASIRMHHSFAEAPQPILENLENYLLTQNPSYWKPVAAFARNIPVSCKKKSRPLPTVPGKYINLQKELDYVKQRYFETPPQATIAWGKAGTSRRRKRRSIRFGSWHSDSQQVHIHPLLDQEWIPLSFMHYLIYHELCHAVAPPYTDNTGRHHIHHREFKALEKQFPDLKQMEKLSTQIFKKLVKMGM
ncbi:hypothetical protein P3T73_13010 [Kiritimatiellota bacterium B12222]|nr:hypothetical protein P3T73_13010 [Kiritimatiellota bacterium B12222]